MFCLGSINFWVRAKWSSLLHPKLPNSLSSKNSRNARALLQRYLTEHVKHKRKMDDYLILHLLGGEPGLLPSVAHLLLTHDFVSLGVQCAATK